MTIMRKKSIVVMLIVLLGAVAVGNAASGIATCPPKKCCCNPSPPMMLDHTGPMDMDVEMDIPHSCAPKEAAPCCSIESDVQPLELAISTSSSSDEYRSLTAYPAADVSIDTPQIPTHINASFDDGWPKVPKIPIFLQTLSILC